MAVTPAVSLGEPPEGDAFEIFPAGEPERFRKSELPEEERTLLRRPDRRRPVEQLTTDVFGRPLTIGWTLESRGRLTKVPFKDQREDKVQRLAFRSSLDLFYRMTEQTSLYLKGNSIYRSKHQRFDNHPLGRDDDRDRERGFRRGEMWLFTRNMWDSPLSLQAGRQRFTDERQWWWDENLDAIRLHYDRPSLHGELAIAQELAKTASYEPHIDPEQEDVLRFLGRATWEWHKHDRVELFFLHQDDRSDTETAGQFVKSSREDESDAELTWVGISARGRVKLGRPGQVRYWVDSALVSGRESYVDYTGSDDNRSVDLVTRHGVSGWGVDAGATWRTRLLGRPAFTLGFAVGSGDRRGKDLGRSDRQKGSDRSFRQTGIEDNNGRFRGVDRFKYYGELLDPELSNLQIGTAAVGFRLLEASSVELLYHWYRQREAAKFLRGADIRRQPSGRRHSIGREIDLVIGIEEWENLDIELVAAAFQAGAAYGDHFDSDDPVPAPADFVPATRGDWSYLFAFKVQLHF